MKPRHITITYRKPGTSPPIYVAGTFSNPAWQPQEMDHHLDEKGDMVFEKGIALSDGTHEITYKFRIGTGDWWAVDQDAETVLDSRGNENNVLHVDSSDADEEELQPDEDDCPMLSHESFENPAYSDRFQADTSSASGRDDEETIGSVSSFDPYKDVDEADLHDPRLEKFPSRDRHSIVAMMRQIETSTNEDRIVGVGEPPSPTVPSLPSSSLFGPPEVKTETTRRTTKPRGSSGSLNNQDWSPRGSLISIREDLEESHPDTRKRRNGQNAGAVEKSFQSLDGTKSNGSGSQEFVNGPARSETSAALHEAQSDDEDEGIAMRTSRHRNNGSAHVGKSNTSSTNHPSGMSASIHSVQTATGHSHWLSSFLRVVFIDWIGGFISSTLFGDRRKATLTLGTAALFIGVFWKAASRDRVQ